MKSTFLALAAAALLTSGAFAQPGVVTIDRSSGYFESSSAGYPVGVPGIVGESSSAGQPVGVPGIVAESSSAGFPVGASGVFDESRTAGFPVGLPGSLDESASAGTVVSSVPGGVPGVSIQIVRPGNWR